MRWDLAREIDWRTVAEDDQTLPGVERDLQSQLQNKALFAKYLQKAEGTAATAEES